MEDEFRDYLDSYESTHDYDECRRNRGVFTEHDYLSLSGDEWEHEKSREAEKSLPSGNGWRMPGGSAPKDQNPKSSIVGAIPQSMVIYEQEQEMAAGMGLFSWGKRQAAV